MAKESIRLVARNTTIMYIRMILLMLIAFFTSRRLLITLGVSDFGVYSVVGSISSTFIAIKSLFSESIQRYLNVAKGKIEDSIEEQVSIFNMSLIIHLVLVIIFILLVEIIGLWLLETRLDIPIERIEAARFVFQMAVISTAISIISIPFDALIIANEKMGIYAGITVFDAILKLIFILLLPLFSADHLKLYSAFLVFIPLITLIIQIYYCRSFPEYQYSLRIDYNLFRGMLALSGWNFFGNICFSIIHEGINMLLNIYGGIIMNAARAVAYQVRNATNQISVNTLVAVRPRIMQQSVQISLSAYFDNIFLLSRISFFTLGIAIVPIFVFSPQLLGIWLNQVPPAAPLFTRILLIGLFIRALHEPLNMMNMAFAKIKRMMIIEMFIMLSTLIVIYLALKSTGHIWLPFTILACMELTIILLIALNAYYELGFPILEYGKKVIIPMFLFASISTMVGYIMSLLYGSPNILKTLLLVILLALLEVIICLFFLNDREKQIIRRLLVR